MKIIIHFNIKFSNALKYRFIILHNIYNINNQLSRCMMYELLLFYYRILYSLLKFLLKIIIIFFFLLL